MTTQESFSPSPSAPLRICMRKKNDARKNESHARRLSLTCLLSRAYAKMIMIAMALAHSRMAHGFSLRQKVRTSSPSAGPRKLTQM